MLDEGVHMRDFVGRDLHQWPDQRRICGDITQPPTVHRIGFGKGAHGDGAFLHARQGCDRYVLRAVVGDFFVDLIREDQQIVFLRKISDDLQFTTAIDAARGITGIDQGNHARRGRDMWLYQGPIDGKTIRSIQGRDGHTGAGQFCLADVLGVVGCKQEAFVTVLQERHEGGE